MGHFGNINQRVKLEVTITTHPEFWHHGTYGKVYKVTATDPQGTIFIWGCPKIDEYKLGEKVILTGKVVLHTMEEGRKTTQLAKVRKETC